MKKVAIEIWDMYSDPGYVGSSGWQDVFMIPVESIKGDAVGNPDALYDIAREYERWDGDVEDQEPVRWRTGALNYKGYTGIITVPDGYVAVQASSEDICTNDGVRRYAKILNKESLLQLYKKRAERYQGLVQDFSKKEAV